MEKRTLNFRDRESSDSFRDSDRDPSSSVGIITAKKYLSNKGTKNKVDFPRKPSHLSYVSLVIHDDVEGNSKTSFQVPEEGTTQSPPLMAQSSPSTKKHHEEWRKNRSLSLPQTRFSPIIEPD